MKIAVEEGDTPSILEDKIAHRLGVKKHDIIYFKSIHALKEKTEEKTEHGVVKKTEPKVLLVNNKGGTILFESEQGLRASKNAEIEARLAENKGQLLDYRKPKDVTPEELAKKRRTCKKNCGT